MEVEYVPNCMDFLLDMFTLIPLFDKGCHNLEIFDFTRFKTFRIVKDETVIVGGGDILLYVAFSSLLVGPLLVGA